MTDPARPVGRVFRRSLVADPPVAVEARDSTIRDAEGREYIDAAGGAIVVNVGHGRASIVAAMAGQSARLAYAHGSAFTSEPLEAYAAAVADVLPVDVPAIYPVSGGSEAIETALKLARIYHLARGEPDRDVLISRYGSYHGNTLGALDAGGRPALRAPYDPWLGRFRHVSAAYPYRAGEPDAHALGDGEALAAELESAIREAGRGRVAAFLAEPIVGATLGAVVPPDDYWPAIADACARHGVLLIADEVMTGFGRTGRWFGLDHWGVRPDILVAAKGTTGGYWPFAFTAASGRIFETVTAPGKGFVHGFTHSHSVVGAAVAGEVLRILRDERLVEASAEKGVRLTTLLKGALEEHPAVGEVRGRGLMVGVEFVADRSTRRPFPRAARVAEAVLGAARERGVLVYMGTGNADGVDGDTILVGPPFVITDEEMQRVAEVLAESIEVATASVVVAG
ncbi:MAG TPA: aminotransferase class III-fold pyridoxal phosphate-dependent enzyme [Candidatus Limnocylindrales bacterium]|nr:aminotransferase class III-fold pyridoxal phosphate-dependent enzyme [Candidatus Limnocylindrales bacterium]